MILRAGGSGDALALGDLTAQRAVAVRERVDDGVGAGGVGADRGGVAQPDDVEPCGGQTLAQLRVGQRTGPGAGEDDGELPRGDPEGTIEKLVLSGSGSMAGSVTDGSQVRRPGPPPPVGGDAVHAAAISTSAPRSASGLDGATRPDRRSIGSLLGAR